MHTPIEIREKHCFLKMSLPHHHPHSKKCYLLKQKNCYNFPQFSATSIRGIKDLPGLYRPKETEYSFVVGKKASEKSYDYF